MASSVNASIGPHKPQNDRSQVQTDPRDERGHQTHTLQQSSNQEDQSIQQAPSTHSETDDAKKRYESIVKQHTTNETWKKIENMDTINLVFNVTLISHAIDSVLSDYDSGSRKRIELDLDTIIRVWQLLQQRNDLSMLKLPDQIWQGCARTFSNVRECVADKDTSGGVSIEILNALSEIEKWFDVVEARMRSPRLRMFDPGFVWEDEEQTPRAPYDWHFPSVVLPFGEQHPDMLKIPGQDGHWFKGAQITLEEQGHKQLSKMEWEFVHLFTSPLYNIYVDFMQIKRKDLSQCDGTLRRALHLFGKSTQDYSISSSLLQNCANMLLTMVRRTFEKGEVRTWHSAEEMSTDDHWFTQGLNHYKKYTWQIWDETEFEVAENDISDHRLSPYMMHPQIDFAGVFQSTSGRDVYKTDLIFWITQASDLPYVYEDQFAASHRRMVNIQRKENQASGNGSDEQNEDDSDDNDEQDDGAHFEVGPAIFANIYYQLQHAKDLRERQYIEALEYCNQVGVFLELLGWPRPLNDSWNESAQVQKAKRNTQHEDEDFSEANEIQKVNYQFQCFTQDEIIGICILAKKFRAGHSRKAKLDAKELDQLVDVLNDQVERLKNAAQHCMALRKQAEEQRKEKLDNNSSIGSLGKAMSKHTVFSKVDNHFRAMLNEITECQSEIVQVRMARTPRAPQSPPNKRLKKHHNNQDNHAARIQDDDSGPEESSHSSNQEAGNQTDDDDDHDDDEGQAQPLQPRANGNKNSRKRAAPGQGRNGPLIQRTERPANVNWEDVRNAALGRGPYDRPIRARRLQHMFPWGFNDKGHFYQDLLSDALNARRDDGSVIFDELSMKGLYDKSKKNHKTFSALKAHYNAADASPEEAAAQRPRRQSTVRSASQQRHPALAQQQQDPPALAEQPQDLHALAQQPQQTTQNQGLQSSSLERMLAESIGQNQEFLRQQREQNQVTNELLRQSQESGRRQDELIKQNQQNTQQAQDLLRQNSEIMSRMFDEMRDMRGTQYQSLPYGMLPGTNNRNLLARSNSRMQITNGENEMDLNSMNRGYISPHDLADPQHLSNLERAVAQQLQRQYAPHDAFSFRDGPGSGYPSNSQSFQRFPEYQQFNAPLNTAAYTQMRYDPGPPPYSAFQQPQYQQSTSSGYHTHDDQDQASSPAQGDYTRGDETQGHPTPGQGN